MSQITKNYIESTGPPKASGVRENSEKVKKLKTLRTRPQSLAKEPAVQKAGRCYVGAQACHVSGGVI